MNENNIKKAFDNVEPEAGARERMYANILKKAAEQEKNETTAQRPEGRDIGENKKLRSISAWRRYGSLAACLVIVIAAAIMLPRASERQDESDPPVLAGSPFEDVDGADGFEKLGFTIDAPEGAEDVRYCIVDGEIARVRFSLGGHEYIYEAAKLDGNFSCADSDAVGSVSLNAEYGAVLDRLSPDTWRAHWTRSGVSFYLSSFDGADEESVTAAANALMDDK